MEEAEMTALMEKAWAETNTLSEREQNLIAQVVLDTIEDEREWDRQFAASQDMLNFLADKALAEYHAGQTKEIRA
jgi:hypothetical protein